MDNLFLVDLFRMLFLLLIVSLNAVILTRCIGHLFMNDEWVIELFLRSLCPESVHLVLWTFYHFSFFACQLSFFLHGEGLRHILFPFI